MKILFTLNGLTHYFNAILNRLNRYEELEIVVIAPEKNNKSVGKGVFLTQQGIEFKVHFSKELKRFYGKAFFQNFKNILESEQPDAIVFIWPYILELVYNPLLLFKLKRKKIKIVFKEIPFQLQSFYDALTFKPFKFIDENLVQQGVSLKGKIVNFFLGLIRKYYYSIIDLNLHYIEDGYSILKTYGVPRNKIVVTFNSPDTDRLIEAKNKSLKLDKILPDNPFRLIHVGRLVKWKRVDLVIKAVAELSQNYPKIELIVIGDGPEIQNLKNIAQDLQVENRIKFIGAIYDPVLLARYFNSSSIYVLGGMGGLSINEAMVFEKPIICSLCDGTEKVLVKDGFNGYIFENGNLESLTQKLTLLLSDKNKIHDFGKNSLSIILNKININTVVSNYFGAFSKLLKNE